MKMDLRALGIRPTSLLSDTILFNDLPCSRRITLVKRNCGAWNLSAVVLMKTGTPF